MLEEKQSQCGVHFQNGLSGYQPREIIKNIAAENLLNCSNFGKVLRATLLAKYHKKSLV